MKISILVEGKTEKAFIPYLRNFLERHLTGTMPRLDPVTYDGRIPKEDKLRRIVENLLAAGNNRSDAVIALTDVYTGSSDFEDADDAKNKMHQWVGNETMFYPHAAQYDFEAWLLPYWSDLQRLAGHNLAVPGNDPEQVNHMNPPSKRIRDLFRTGSKGKAYVKARDAARILRTADLSVSISRCNELKKFINTILTLCGSEPLP